MRAAALVAVLLAACTVEPVDFSEKMCPCDQGFTCDMVLMRCVEGTIEPPEEGLLVHWAFEDDLLDGASDDASANGRVATCSAGECPLSVVGRIGSGVELDGVAHTMSASDPSAFATFEAFTVAVWIRPLAITQSAAVVKAREAAEGVVSWSVGIDAAGRALVVLGDSSGETHITSSELGAVRAGEWAHVALVWDAPEVRLYLGGEAVAVVMGAIAFDGGALHAGGDGASPSRLPWNGVLDEVRLYDRALEGSAIAELAVP